MDNFTDILKKSWNVMQIESFTENSNIKFPFAQVGSILFNVSGTHTEQHNCAITITPTGFSSVQHINSVNPQPPNTPPTQDFENTFDFNLVPSSNCFLGKIGGATSKEGDTTTWVNTSISKLDKSSASKQLDSKLQLDLYKQANKICVWVRTYI